MKKLKVLKNKSLITCDKCPAKCCRYVAIELDEPEDGDDFEDIKWYVSHENIIVGIDNDGDWLIEFKTNCKHIKDNKCSIYEKRPQVCRDHELDSCEMNGEGDPYEIIFRNIKDVEDYMEKNNIKQFKYK